MSENPYASPSTASQSQPISAAEIYRPANGLVLALTVMFVLGIGLDLLSGAMSLVEATVFSEYVGQEELDEDSRVLGFYIAYGCVGLSTLPVYVATAVLFCMWVFRANKNARALGAQAMTFTPGWSVGWFFVPIMNLFRPYQAVREIHQASHPNADSLSWKYAPVSAVLGWWWALWIISNILGQVEFRLALRGDQEMALAGAYLGAVTGVLGAITALLAMQVVRGTHQRQQLKAERKSPTGDKFAHDQDPETVLPPKRDW
jgi:hypothetical protein